MNSGKSERLNDPLGFLLLAPLAQLAEHRTLNPQVPGSSPGGRTNKSPTRVPIPSAQTRSGQRGASRTTVRSWMWRFGTLASRDLESSPAEVSLPGKPSGWSTSFVRSPLTPHCDPTETNTSSTATGITPRARSSCTAFPTATTTTVAIPTHGNDSSTIDRRSLPVAESARAKRSRSTT